MMRFMLLSALLVAMPPTPQSLATAGDLQRLPVATVADALLPPGHPPIAHIRFGGYGLVPLTYNDVTLFTTATPVGDDFCSQQMITVRTTPIPSDPAAAFNAMPKPIGEIWRGTLYRYRPLTGQCDGRGTAFGIYGLPIDRGFTVVRLLAGAVARTGKVKVAARLPFTLACDGQLGLCDRLGALQALDIGALASVEKAAPGDLKRYGAIGRAARRGGELFDISVDTRVPALQQNVHVLIRDGLIRSIRISTYMVTY